MGGEGGEKDVWIMIPLSGVFLWIWKNILRNVIVLKSRDIFLSRI